jgi:signal transduction histidine kinase
MAIYFHDVIERRGADQVLRLEHSPARCLADAEDPAAALVTIMREICESESWDLGRCFRLDEGADLMRFEGFWGRESDEIERMVAASRDHTLRPCEGLEGAAWLSGDANCERFMRLVNGILDLERLESGHVAYDLRVFEVRPMIEEVIQGSRGFADLHGVQIRLAGARTNCAVRADSDRLAQVMTNLLSNAIKVSAKGDEVTVRIEPRGEVVAVRKSRAWNSHGFQIAGVRESFPNPTPRIRGIGLEQAWV